MRQIDSFSKEKEEGNNMKKLGSGIWLVCFSSLLFLILTASWASGFTAPRFGPTLLKPEGTIKIFAYQYPPLIDFRAPGKGAIANIVHAALAEAGIEVRIEVVPIKSLAKHSMLYEDGAAMLGEAYVFSEMELKELIVVPCYSMTWSYYCYLPAHREGINFNENLENLKEYTYGALAGEDITLYEKSGIKVVSGNLKSLLRKLKGGGIDFLGAPDIIARKYIRMLYPDEIGNFRRIRTPVWTSAFSLFFNTGRPQAGELKKAYIEGLDKIKQSGEYGRIMSLYEKEDLTQASETIASSLTLAPIEFGSSDTLPFFSPDLPEDGMAGEMLHAIFAEIGIKSRILYFPLKRLQRDLRGNHLGDPVNFTGQQFSAVIPIALYRAAFFYYRPRHKEGIIYKNPEDLNGYTIGMIRGTLENKGYFEKKSIRIIEANNESSLFRQLKEGRIDLCGVIKEAGEFIVKKEYPDETDNFVPIEIPKSLGPVTVMIDRNYTHGRELGVRVEEGLKEIMENGKYLQILEKYYGKGNVPDDWFADLEKYRNRYRQTQSN
jgi:polar amino acid transport system substrate-binding protein